MTQAGRLMPPRFTCLLLGYLFVNKDGLTAEDASVDGDASRAGLTSHF
jgi:hypothetical protein